MPTNLAAWTRLLDTFEAALDDPDGEAAPPPFDPPPGPPPVELVDRAHAVLARQRASIDGLLAARENIARELAAIRRIPSTEPVAPVYLDVEG